MADVKYKRVLLKLSGESLCKQGGFGIDDEAIMPVAERISKIAQLGLDVAIVVGGGNFLRGQTFSQGSSIPRYTADYMGMMATVINACALRETLEAHGQPARVLSAISVPQVSEPFAQKTCHEHFEKGRVVILAGGTGVPFFSTDTCAALRACEIGADLIIKATKVEGVYTDDPMTNPDAELLHEISFQRVINDNLKVIDAAAMSLCGENDIPVIVLNIFKEGYITKALCGEKVGTLISK